MNGRYTCDDSLFVTDFGVGTNSVVVYKDAYNSNVSIRAAFNISGTGADNALESSTYRAEFLAGIKGGWENSTTGVYVAESSTGIKIDIVNGGGTSNVSNFFGGFVEAFWSPSNPGTVTMYAQGVTSQNFKETAAHEFGHILGIDDGYNNNTYKYYDSIMCDPHSKRNGTGKASSLDIAKAIKAYQTKKFQKWR